MALITAAEARELIPEITGTGLDTTLNNLIAAVDRAFARECGYPPASVGVDPTMEDTTYTRYQRGPGGRILELEVRPVVSVTTIYDDPDGDYGADTVVDSADYDLLDANAGTVLLGSASSHGAWSRQVAGSIPAIRATYVAGYEVVPDGLKHLAKLAVKAMWTARPTTTPSERGNDEPDAALPREVRRGLQAYRLPRAVVPA